MKYFYEHIFDIDGLHSDLSVLELTDAERNHIVLMVQSTMHHVVMDVLLEELHDDHKHAFLARVAEEDHEKVWEILREHLDDPEGLIRGAIDALKVELMEDITEAQKFMG